MENNNYNEFVVRTNAALNNREKNPTGFENALQDLAQMAVYSTLKRLDAATNTDTANNYRRGLYNDLKNAAALRELTENGENVSDIIGAGMSDGSDLYQSAILAILTEMEKSAARSEKDFDLIREYTYKKPSRRVLIGDQKPELKDASTSPVKEIYKAVRREIQAARTVKPCVNGYSYIAEYETADESADNVIYRRFGKYADVGGYTVNANGATKTYTADNTAAKIPDLIEKMSLSPYQTEILNYRLQGYSINAIAQKMGIRHEAVVVQLRRTREKALKIGLKP